jgi:hypothetical protein
VAGTAIAGKDYYSLGKSVYFPPLTTTATKTVRVIEDSLREPLEYVGVGLLPGTGYRLVSPTNAVVSIKSDE